MEGGRGVTLPLGAGVSEVDGARGEGDACDIEGEDD